MLNSLFNYFRNKNGFFQWLLQRISACLLVFSIVFFYSYLPFIFVCFIGLGFHLFAGIETLIDYYVHDFSLPLFRWIVWSPFLKNVFIFYYIN